MWLSSVDFCVKKLYTNRVHAQNEPFYQLYFSPSACSLQCLIGGGGTKLSHCGRDGRGDVELGKDEVGLWCVHILLSDVCPLYTALGFCHFPLQDSLQRVHLCTSEFTFALHGEFIFAPVSSSLHL